MDAEKLDQLSAEWVFIRSTVECGLDTDMEWFTYPRAEWEAMTEKERDRIRTDYAVEHQNNFAPCGASEVDDLDDVPKEILADPESAKL